ncbi:sialate O-acetylesterase [Vagococcus sp. BWB3-3]|uniref:Sialate O-acetylesterase n=1 Tax=Vagococcus allomyrinae TaxID=2794353 RepID=A0A940P8Q5_9ENTE|nr:sialate O-acetylesterase [Vagococcus allomyrinae]MBP1039603.1 sialate O-acetylesterase [Vagococcus allomyrinae]
MIHSFLMLGQSNMAGRGFVSQVPPIYNERIQMLRNGRWQMMTEPINYDRPVAGVSLASSFADAWSSAHQEEIIGLIPCAEGGSPIEDWQPEGALFQHAISQAKFAMKNSQLSGLLWHQGESNSMAGGTTDYYDKLLVIVKALRKELAAPDLPLIIGGLGNYLGEIGFGAGCKEYQTINDALQRFAFEQGNCYFVTAAELTSNPDGIHLDAISQRRFGLRYFEAFQHQQHVLAPLPHEEKTLSDMAKRPHTQNEKIYLASLEMAMGEIPYSEFEARVAALYQKQA